MNQKGFESIFYWSGLTLHACQQLEFGLKVVLVAMAEAGFGDFAHEDVIAIVEDEKKRTLGQVLSSLKRKVRISDGWLNALERALEVRNRFIHGYLVDEAENIVNPVTRGDVLDEIKSFRRAILSGDTVVRQILETMLEFQGIDFSQQMQVWQEEASLQSNSRSDSNDSTMLE